MVDYFRGYRPVAIRLPTGLSDRCGELAGVQPQEESEVRFGEVVEEFDGGKGRPMKEWLAVSGLDTDVWSSLARETSEFLSSRKR